MGVQVEEFVKIQDLEGNLHEGKGLAGELVAVKNDEGTFYGKLVALAKVRTTVVCDLLNECCRGTIDGEFHTLPRVISFDDEGKGPGEFIRDVAEVTILTDYKGGKLVFCSFECSAKYCRRAGKNSNVIVFPGE